MPEEQQRALMFKEIDLIQAIISRMASNSFLIKGWAISVIASVLVLKQPEVNAILAALPLMAFWYVDALYLRKERLYRRLYDWVIKNRMATNEYLLDLNTKRFEDRVDSVYKVMFSGTLCPLYGIMLIIILAWWGLPLLHSAPTQQPPTNAQRVECIYTCQGPERRGDFRYGVQGTEA